MARPESRPTPSSRDADVRRRRRGVRRARLRRRQRGPHRPRRPPQQGDDLLPLQEQGGALPRDPARHVRRRRARASPPSPRPTRRPTTRFAATSRPSPPRPRRGRTFRRSGCARSPKAAEHVDAATLGYVRDVLAALGAIIDGGRARRRASQPVAPARRAGGIIAPLMFFLATAPLRRKIARAGVAGVARSSRATWSSPTFSASTLAQLEGKIA